MNWLSAMKTRSKPAASACCARATCHETSTLASPGISGSSQVFCCPCPPTPCRIAPNFNCRSLMSTKYGGSGSTHLESSGGPAGLRRRAPGGSVAARDRGRGGAADAAFGERVRGFADGAEGRVGGGAFGGYAVRRDFGAVLGGDRVFGLQLPGRDRDDPVEDAAEGVG